MIVIFLYIINISSSPVMNSTNIPLSLIHPDDVKEPITHVSNMPFDEYIDCYNNADYGLDYRISPESEALEISKISSEYSNESNSPDLLFNLLNLNIKDPQTDMETEINENIKLPETLVINGINLGDGKMDYIQNKHDKTMMTNAWHAITQTNNWNFVAKDIESFMFSNDPRIKQITVKMKELGYDLHSGCSFGCTMRNMQFLAKKGEKKFKELF